MILYDLLLVVVGIFIGVITADPLKKLFTGGYKEEMRQKKRVKLLLYLRENTKIQKPTTSDLASSVFNGKLDEGTVHKLLEEIEEIGLIKSTPGKPEDKKWFYVNK
ncbi:hypothetical protein ACM26V_22860 [Salipaludibacillus sp. HK11]|uniref:hypothetical protein n=1 Tax=Salipaludibacillus sp. HK11 TaxID=3394320 RepID=UPI0039FD0844